MLAIAIFIFVCTVKLQTPSWFISVVFSNTLPTVILCCIILFFGHIVFLSPLPFFTCRIFLFSWSGAFVLFLPLLHYLEEILLSTFFPLLSSLKQHLSVLAVFSPSRGMFCKKHSLLQPFEEKLSFCFFETFYPFSVSSLPASCKANKAG